MAFPALNRVGVIPASSDFVPVGGFIGDNADAEPALADIITVPPQPTVADVRVKARLEVLNAAGLWDRHRRPGRLSEYPGRTAITAAGSNMATPGAPVNYLTIYTVPAGKTLYITSAQLSSSIGVLVAAGIAITQTEAQILAPHASGSGTVVANNAHAGLGLGLGLASQVLLSNQGIALTFPEPYPVLQNQLVQIAWQSSLSVGQRNASGSIVGYLE